MFILWAEEQFGTLWIQLHKMPPEVVHILQDHLILGGVLLLGIWDVYDLCLLHSSMPISPTCVTAKYLSVKEIF